MKVCLKCSKRFDNSDWKCPACDFKPEMISGYFAFAPELAYVNNNYRPDAFQKLYDLEESSFWFQSRNLLILWTLKKYFSEAKNFLEIGCGTGFVLSGLEHRFQNLLLFGSEIYIEGLDFAAKRLKNVQLFQMDACRIPFDDEFDVIGAFDVLEHIEYDEIVLSQMYQAVRQGGGIILTVPQHPFLWSKIDENACHVRRYTAGELKVKVEKAGFTIVRMTSFVSILLPIMIISRLIKKRDAEAKSELEINRWVNGIFKKVVDIERSLISWGISFPAGGSILTIAYKKY